MNLELNPYKASSINDFSDYYKNIILSIEDQIKNSGKKLEKLKENNKEMKKSLDEKLEVS